MSQVSGLYAELFSFKCIRRTTIILQRELYVPTTPWLQTLCTNLQLCVAISATQNRVQAALEKADCWKDEGTAKVPISI